MASRVIGIKATKMTSGKNEGKTGFNYFLSEPFSEYEKENGECAGEKVSSEFSYTKFNVKVGDSVNPVYGKGFQGKAVLEDLIPIK